MYTINSVFSSSSRRIYTQIKISNKFCFIRTNSVVRLSTDYEEGYPQQRSTIIHPSEVATCEVTTLKSCHVSISTLNLQYYVSCEIDCAAQSLKWQDHRKKLDQNDVPIPAINNRLWDGEAVATNQSAWKALAIIGSFKIEACVFLAWRLQPCAGCPPLQSNSSTGLASPTGHRSAMHFHPSQTGPSTPLICAITTGGVCSLSRRTGSFREQIIK